MLKENRGERKLENRNGRLRGFVLASFVNFLDKPYKRIPNAFGIVQSLRLTKKVLGTFGYFWVRTSVNCGVVVNVNNWPDGRPRDGDTGDDRDWFALSEPLG